MESLCIQRTENVELSKEALDKAKQEAKEARKALKAKEKEYDELADKYNNLCNTAKKYQENLERVRGERKEARDRCARLTKDYEEMAAKYKMSHQETINSWKASEDGQAWYRQGAGSARGPVFKDAMFKVENAMRKICPDLTDSVKRHIAGQVEADKEIIRQRKAERAAKRQAEQEQAVAHHGIHMTEASRPRVRHSSGSSSHSQHEQWYGSRSQTPVPVQTVQGLSASAPVGDEEAHPSVEGSSGVDYSEQPGNVLSLIPY